MDMINITIGGQTLEVKKEDMTKALEDGNLSIENNLKVFSEDDYTTLIGNIETEKYNEGKTAGEQMAVKAARDEYGLEFEGKTVANFATALKSKIEADSKIEPNTKIKELQEDNDKLRGNISEWEGKFNNLQEAVENEKKANKIDSLINKEVPQEGLLINAKSAVNLYKMSRNIEFDESDNAVIIRDGQILKNETTRSPISIKDDFSSFLQEEGLIKKPSGGSGGGDDTGAAKAGTLEAFTKEMEEKDIKSNSLEFQKEMQKRIKDGTLKI